jgi:hypothetical protein
LKSNAVAICIVAIAAVNAQTGGKAAGTPPVHSSEQNETDLRSLFAENFEKNWNNHQPAAAVAPDRCVDDAIFINTTGGWVDPYGVCAAVEQTVKD